MRIKEGTVFAQEGSNPDEVYFLLVGCVLRSSKDEEAQGLKPHYLIEGAMFGEKDMMLNRPLKESYTAMGNCYLLKVTRPLFKQLMEEFEDFRHEVVRIGRERERMKFEDLKLIESGQKLQ
jgi:CRP-like cAMP-binding protein